MLINNQDILKKLVVFKIIYSKLIQPCAIFIILVGLTSCNQSTANIIQTVESPTGNYVAYVFEKNAGATQPFIYRLTVLKKDQSFRVSNGNTYISRDLFQVEWKDDSVLFVDNSFGDAIFLQHDNVGKVMVQYNYKVNTGR